MFSALRSYQATQEIQGSSCQEALWLSSSSGPLPLELELELELVVVALTALVC